jgi:hypothetical protein
MNLLVRINLALAAAFALAALAVGGTSYSMLQASAKREALQEAGLMMDSVLSMRAYTSEEIVTLLSTQMTHDFLPQSVPSYAASQNFLKLRDHHHEYKRATDGAQDWERLVARLAAEIDSDVARAEFISACRTPRPAP